MAKRKTAEQRLAALIDEIGIERVESFVQFWRACSGTETKRVVKVKHNAELDKVAETAAQRSRKTKQDEKTMSAAGTSADDLFRAGKKAFEEKAIEKSAAAGAENRIRVE